MKNVSIALLGCGTVGKGVVDLLAMNGPLIEEQLNTKINIKRVLIRDLNKYEKMEDLPDSIQLTTDFNDIINDDEIDIVVEVMGSADFAKDCIEQCFLRGKSVISANKDLIADYGIPLLKLSQQHNVDFQFEASVAGGIPIVRPMYSSLNSNRIEEIIGIMNGTTNYILTNMAEHGMSYEDALAEATALGYAEADPTADVEGLDAGRKVAILANIAFHTPAVFDDVHVEGITKISKLDMAYAESIGCVIKLLGIVSKEEDGLSLSVHPAIIAKSHPLASVGGSFNAVFVQGDAIDEAMFYGRGAGKLPTASAVVGDVIDICRDIVYGCEGRIGDYTYENIPIKPMSKMKSRFYVRLCIPDRPGVLGEVGMLFGDSGVSIAQAMQKDSSNSEDAEFVIITHEVLEEKFNEALARMENADSVRQVENVIRIYGRLPQ